MSGVFISHSSHDSAAADRLAHWLRSQGYTSLFLDFDPVHGIPPGRSWERELYAALRSARAVVVLCSHHSMSSEWCFAEITHARALGKAVFPVRIDECTVKPILSDLQGIDFGAGEKAGYQRLSTGLRAAGLDPGDAFSWDASRAPFPGLIAFQKADAGVFFGRDAEIHGGLDALSRAQRFGGVRLSVFVGASGSGKSSLLRAGILPRLQRDPSRWWVIPPLRPRREPLRELAISLAEAGQGRAHWPTRDALHQRLAAPDGDGHTLLTELAEEVRAERDRRDATAVLIIDQLEELLADPSSEANAQFLTLITNLLTGDDSCFHVAATLRSDFLSEFQLEPRLRTVAAQTLPVARMQPSALVQVIEGPAALAGIELDAGLTQALIDDAQTDDALPLLAFTLRQMWDRYGEQRRFGLHEYREQLGGLEGSVRDTAEGVIRSAPVSDAEHAALRRAMLALVRINEDGAFVRRPVPWNDLPSDAHAVLERFIAARLLVASGADSGRIVEVAHEALFRSWDRLREWLDEDRDFLLWRRRTRIALAAWKHSGMDRDALPRGVALAEARSQLDRRREDLGDEEIDFITQAARHHERDQQARRRRNRIIAAGLGALSVVSLLFGWYAYDRSRVADSARSVAETAAGAAEAARVEAEDALAAASAARARAETERRRAIARALASKARSHTEGRADLALLLGVEAQRLMASPDTSGALLGAVQSARYLHTHLARHAFPVLSVAFSLDGSILASGSRDHSIILWDVSSGRPRGPRLTGHSNWVQSVAFSPDGTLLASASDDFTIRLWDVATGKPKGEPLQGHRDSVVSVAFSPDGKLLASGGADGTLRLWSTTTWTEVMAPRKPGARWVTGIAFHPDGHLIAATGDKAVSVLQVPSGEERYRLSHEGEGWAVAFAPDGRSLAASSRRRILVWDLETRSLKYPPRESGNEWSIGSIGFSPDGERLIAGNNEGRLLMWQAHSGEPAGATPPRHAGQINSIAFDPTGRLFASASHDGNIIIRRTRPSQRLHRTVIRQPRRLHAVAAAPSGTLVAVGADDGQVLLGNADAAGSLIALKGPLQGRVAGLAFTRSGDRLAAGARNGKIAVWDVSSRALLTPELEGHDKEVLSVSFSADGKSLLSGGSDGRIILWDLASGRPRIEPIRIAPRHWVWAVATSPDGSSFAHVAERGSVALRESTFGERLGRALTGHNRNLVKALAFSPDGATLASGSADTSVALWDVASGRMRENRLLGHESMVMDLGFSPDGTTLVTASRDSTLKLWHVASGQPIGPSLVSAGGAQLSVAWSSKGDTVYSASYDGGLSAWAVSPAAWEQAACTIANRNLTHEEWQLYLGSEPYRETCPGHAPAYDADTGLNLLDLSRIAITSGEYGEALNLARRAALTLREALPPGHPDLVPALLNLGHNLGVQAAFTEAIGILREALELARSRQASDPEAVFDALNSLGAAHYWAGDDARAEMRFREALGLRDEGHELSALSLETVHSNLGAALINRGQLDEAGQHLEIALASTERRLPADDPRLMFVLRNVGLLHHRAGRLEEAEAAYRRALTVWQPLRMEATDANEAIVHARLGELYLDQARLDEATPLLEQALAVRERVLERHHPRLVESLRMYARLLRARGLTDQAKRYEARLAGRKN